VQRLRHEPAKRGGGRGMVVRILGRRGGCLPAPGPTTPAMSCPVPVPSPSGHPRFGRGDTGLAFANPTCGAAHLRLGAANPRCGAAHPGLGAANRRLGATRLRGLLLGCAIGWRGYSGLSPCCALERDRTSLTRRRTVRPAIALLLPQPLRGALAESGGFERGSVACARHHSALHAGRFHTPPRAPPGA
jgi:hypothetical protein